LTLERQVVPYNKALSAKIRAIVFDLDATLYDDPRFGDAVHAEAYGYIAENRGIDPAAAAELLRQTKHRLTETSGGAGTLSLAIGDLGLDLQVLHCRFAERLEPAQYVPRDERVVDLLRALARGYQLVLYTNNNRLLSAKIMAVLGITEYFSQVFTIEETWRPKPDAGTLKLLFATIGKTPGECLFVGDRFDVDLRLPQQMGAQVYQVVNLADLLQLAAILEGA